MFLWNYKVELLILSLFYNFQRIINRKSAKKIEENSRKRAQHEFCRQSGWHSSTRPGKPDSVRQLRHSWLSQISKWFFFLIFFFYKKKTLINPNQLKKDHKKSASSCTSTATATTSNSKSSNPTLIRFFYSFLWAKSNFLKKLIQLKNLSLVSSNRMKCK